jgi:hypothetical protein
LGKNIKAQAVPEYENAGISGIPSLGRNSSCNPVVKPADIPAARFSLA